MHAAKTLFIHS